MSATDTSSMPRKHSSQRFPSGPWNSRFAAGPENSRPVRRSRHPATPGHWVIQYTKHPSGEDGGRKSIKRGPEHPIHKLFKWIVLDQNSNRDLVTTFSLPSQWAQIKSNAQERFTNFPCVSEFQSECICGPSMPVTIFSQ